MGENELDRWHLMKMEEEGKLTVDTHGHSPWNSALWVIRITELPPG